MERRRRRGGTLTVKEPAGGASPESSWLTGQSSVAPDGLWIFASTRPRAPLSCTAKEASWPALRAFSCTRARTSDTPPAHVSPENQEASSLPEGWRW